jgi:GntP family gluconate:H+ symporter
MWLIILLILAIVFIIISTSVFKWHPFLSLIIAAFGFGIFSGTMSLTDVVSAVNGGFGNTIGYIGIVILAGSIIGKFLEKSGGAFKLATGALKIVGKKNMPLAMSIVGYIVSIPVFCDSAFIVLSPLSKALAKTIKISFAVMAMSLSLGLFITHHLIPPTPGPVAAAGILEADLGTVILLGLPVSLLGLVIAWLFSVKYAKKFHVALDKEPVSGSGVNKRNGENKKSESNPGETYEEDNKILDTFAEGPSLLKSLLPIFIPIILIILRSVNDLPSAPFGSGNAAMIIGFIGQPSVALLIGVGLSFLLPVKFSKDMLSSSGWLGEGIVAAATIIIVTGSGGAFGKVLQESGIAEVVKENLSGAQSLGIWLPIIIAMSLKIAQGSGTVSIITTASLMAPLVPSLGMDSPSARALVVVAIGAGSMIASHANDSYFWVVTQMSNMTVNQGYRLQTMGTLILGICTSVLVYLMSLWIL